MRIASSPQYGQASGGWVFSLSSSAATRFSKSSKRVRICCARRHSAATQERIVDQPGNGTTFRFSQSEKGITRWPPNIEQIRIERDSLRVWLIARRNDVELRFPLEQNDCEHLAALLLAEDRS